MSGVTTATIIAVAAVVVSAGTAAYSAYASAEAADEQRDALEEQKRQTMEAASIQSDNQRKQGAATEAQARANAAASGLSLGDENSTVGVIQNQIKSDTEANVDLTMKQAGWQTTNIQNQINTIPGIGEIAGTAAAGFASSALSSYSNYSSMKQQESLLANKTYGTSSSNWIQGGAVPTTGQSFTSNTGVKTGSYSLLG